MKTLIAFSWALLILTVLLPYAYLACIINGAQIPGWDSFITLCLMGILGIIGWSLVFSAAYSRTKYRRVW